VLTRICDLLSVGGVLVVAEHSTSRELL